MLRRVSLLVFVVAIVMAACGRQVTGLNTPGGGSSGGNAIQGGKMLIRFTTQGAMDFTNYRYVIVFNTGGTGGQPYANTYTTSFLNYSFAWVIGGAGGVASPRLFQYYLPGGSTALQSRQLVVPQQNVQLIAPPNSNGTANQFTLIFDRVLFNVPNPASPSPGPSALVATPSPSPTPTAGPTPTACATSSGAGATPCPTASPTAVPAATLSPGFILPTTPAQQTWYINFFTTDLNGFPIDALGTGGKNDTSFNLSVNVTNNVDIVQALAQNINGRTNPPSNQLGAALAGGEILNAP